MAARRSPSLAQISAQLRSLAREGSIFFTAHALEEMASDDLGLADLLVVMGGCRIVEEQAAGKYKVEGRTSEGAPVIAICRPQEAAGKNQRVFVITVWRVNQR